MHQRSACPEKDRITTVVNEFMRQMKNTSRDLPRSHLEETLKAYTRDLKRGGFSQEWIRNTLYATSKVYARILMAECQSISRIKQPEASGKKIRKIKWLTGKATWFTKTKNKEDQIQVKMPPQKSYKRKPPNEPTNNTEVPPETVLFVPYTPRSELKKDIVKSSSEDDEKIKIK